MRKLIAGLFVSADGYATGRDPEDMDWAISHQGPETNQYTLDQLHATDLTIMGRVTYELFAAYWPTASPEDEGEFAELINRIPRMVFSKTLPEALTWKGSQVNRGDLAVEIPKLKEQPGKDIGVAGSVELVRSLLRLGLVDHLRLQVYPSALGATGTKPLFEGFDRTRLTLVDSKVLDGQVVLLDYQPAAPSA